MHSTLIKTLHSWSRLKYFYNNYCCLFFYCCKFVLCTVCSVFTFVGRPDGWLHDHRRLRFEPLTTEIGRHHPKRRGWRRRRRWRRNAAHWWRVVGRRLKRRDDKSIDAAGRFQVTVEQRPTWGQRFKIIIWTLLQRWKIQCGNNYKG